MTTDEIHDLWETGLRRAEWAVDRAYDAGGGDTAKLHLERYFFLMRYSLLRAPSAAVHSIGATAALSLRQIKPWDERRLEAFCARTFGGSSVAHADPPTGDGCLLAWIGAAEIDNLKRKEVLKAASKVFSNQIYSIVKREGQTMDEGNWLNTPASTFFKPVTGKNRLRILGEPVASNGEYGGWDIETDRGTFTIKSESLMQPLRDYAREHRKRITGAILTFTSNGAEGTARRYEEVKVKAK